MVDKAESTRELARMSTAERSPRYSLDVEPSKRSPGSYEWAIRERGKVLQRSDRVHRSEGEALRHGEQELERILHPRDRP